MSDYVGYLVLGSGAGAIIAAFALGLLISQQGAGIVNFSLGAMMTWTAHVYADLRQGAYVFPIPGLPDRYHFAGGDVGFPIAMALSLATAAVLAWIVHRLVFEPLHRAPSLSTIVADIGIIIVLTSLVEARFSVSAGIRVESILPDESVTVIDDFTVPRDGLWLSAIVIAIAIAVWIISRRTRIGLITRAAASNEKGVILLGYSPRAVARRSYIFAVVLASFVGVMASPTLQLESTTYTFAFLIPALGAALVGRFRNVGIAVGTAFAIGMVQSTFTKLQVDFEWFPRYGTREGLPFLIIIVAMWLMGETLPNRGTVETWRLPLVPPTRINLATVGIPLVLAIGGLLLLDPLWRAAIMTSTIAAVFALSFVVVTGLGGQTTLAQMAVAGIGGFALSRIATDAGIPFPIAPLLAATAAMVFGVLVGLPALRVRGTNLAIVTLGGAVAITEFVFKNHDFIGDLAYGGARVPNPSLIGWDFGLVLGDESSRPIFGSFLVIVVLLLALAVANLRRSGTGRRLLAARSNERAALAVGVGVQRTKLLAYAISSFIAGIGGCLIAYRFGRVSDASFGTLASLTALAFAYLGGITSVSGAMTAGVVAASGVGFFALTEVIGGLGTWETLIGGVLLIVTAVLNPEGIAGGFHRDRRGRDGERRPGRGDQGPAEGSTESASADRVVETTAS